MESGSRALEVLVRTEVEGVGWQTNREGLVTNLFGKAKRDRRLAENDKAGAEYPCRQIGCKTEQRRILTDAGTMRDRSDKKESERRREWNRDRGC